MKLTEKELNEFPIGTRIMTNASVYIKTGYDLYACYGGNECFWENKEMITYEVYKVEIPTYTEYIPPKPILDDKEKEYLSNVIRPWKKRIKIIAKHGTGRYEWIVIINKNGENMILPSFKKGTMYKGMELDKEYSLDELGL